MQQIDQLYNTDWSVLPNLWSVLPNSFFAFAYIFAMKGMLTDLEDIDVIKELSIQKG